MTRTGARRISTADEAAQFARQVQARGGTVVFTNGVFDLLHPGHVRYLRDARALGDDVLIVAVNADASVRALNKAPDRPVNPERERAEVLLALESVDAVVIFDDATPHATIQRIAPDVLVKGADWAASDIVGRDGGRAAAAWFASAWRQAIPRPSSFGRYAVCDNRSIAASPRAPASGQSRCTYEWPPQPLH